MYVKVSSQQGGPERPLHEAVNGDIRLLEMAGLCGVWMKAAGTEWRKRQDTGTVSISGRAGLFLETR